MNRDEPIKVKINGEFYEFPKGLKIIDALKEISIFIPTLCYLENVSEEGTCGLCMVEIKGQRALARACITELRDGMEIITDSEKVKKARKLNLEFILSFHPPECITCDSDGNCQLQDLAYKFDLPFSRFFNKNRVLYKSTGAWETNPFIKFHPEKCILCRRCINACRNLAIVDAIGVSGKGYRTKITTPYELNLEKTKCEFCGICIQVCPTGALVEKPRLKKGKIFHLKKTDTVCAFCGVGCEISLYTNKEGKIVLAKGKEDSPVNRGRLCVKGRFGFEYANSPQRLTRPLIRRNGIFEEVEWEEAIDVVSERLLEIKDLYGPNSIAFLGSSRCTNEDNFVLQKFARVVIGTNNVDNCARLCHAPSLVALSHALGAGASTNPIEDIQNAEIFFVIGSNMTETHPVIAQLLKRQVKMKKANLIVCDPRKIDLAYFADVYIQHYPGTDVALINGIIKVILERGLINEEFIREHTEGFDKLSKFLSQYKVEDFAKWSGVDAKLIEKAAELYAKKKSGMIFYTMGITQHATGTEAVYCLANLALITGHIGGKGNGIMPLRGQANVQGACDMGCLPDLLPGYQKVTDKTSREKFEKEWNTSLPSEPGITVSELPYYILDGRIKAVYIMGANPLMTNPDINTVRKAFENLEFCVVHDIFLTETAEYAHVILPAASAYEKLGTFTNTERRVQLLRPAKEKPMGTKYDWEIICEIAQKMGYNLNYKNPEEIMEEIRKLTPAYNGITYKRLQKQGIQWPCPSENHPGTPILHENGKFKKPNQKALFVPVEYKPPKELPDENYPFILTTGRILFHYHSRAETKRVQVIDSFQPENYLEISEEDAKELKIKDGDMLKVESKRGSVITKAKVSQRPKKGVVFLTFHYKDNNANFLTNPQWDPYSKTPEFKTCAVRIEKLV